MSNVWPVCWIRPKSRIFMAHEMISQSIKKELQFFNYRKQNCLLDVAIAFLLHKQAFNTGAEQFGQSVATPNLYCLSAYHIMSPVCQWHPHCPNISLSKTHKNNLKLFLFLRYYYTLIFTGVVPLGIDFSPCGP